MFKKEATVLSKSTDRSMADTDVMPPTEKEKAVTRFETASQVSSTTTPAPEIYRGTDNQSSDRKREMMHSDLK